VGSGSYVGWYPCAPRGWSHAHRAYRHGWNDGYRHGYGDGYQDGWRDARYATWVPRSRVMSENVSHHAVGHEVATHAVARSRVTPMAAPPSKRDVERMVGRSLPETRVVERTATVEGRNVRVVRPEVGDESVRRHGADTVKRALAPEARERTLSTANTSHRRNDPPARSGRASTASSRRAERVEAVATRPGNPTASRSRSHVSRSPAVADSTRKRRSVDAQRLLSTARIPDQTVSRPAVTRGAAPVTEKPARAGRAPVSRAQNRATTTVTSRSGSAAAPSKRRAPQASTSPTTERENTTAARADRSRKPRSNSSSEDTPRQRRPRKPR